MILNILYIAVICVVVIDLSGFVDSLTQGISKWLTSGKRDKPFSLKPISCSLCMTWWVSLGYLIVTHQCSLLSILIALLMAYGTGIIKSILLLINDLVLTLINKINEKIN